MLGNLVSDLASKLVNIIVKFCFTCFWPRFKAYFSKCIQAIKLKLNNGIVEFDFLDLCSVQLGQETFRIVYGHTVRFPININLKNKGFIKITIQEIWFEMCCAGTKLRSTIGMNEKMEIASESQRGLQIPYIHDRSITPVDSNKSSMKSECDICVKAQYVKKNRIKTRISRAILPWQYYCLSSDLNTDCNS